MAKFKVGDKVQLASGGPVMTVEDITNSDSIGVLVVWFDSKYATHRETFPEQALIEADTGPMPGPSFG